MDLPTKIGNLGRESWRIPAQVVHNLGSICQIIGKKIKMRKHPCSFLQVMAHKTNSWLYTRQFVIDGNFTAVHLRQKYPENDVFLADGTGFMTQQAPYQEHLKVAKDQKEVRLEFWL